MCARDADQRAAWYRSFQQETVRTIAYVIEHELPLKEVFTTNYSFQDRNVAIGYARDLLFQGRISELPAQLAGWPVDGAWASRDEAWPGAHAGILTNRQLLWMSDAPRDRMRLFFDRAWCKQPSSFGVDVEVFRELVHGVADLRNKGARWQELAAQPGCTTCHARLDYGMQFFAGYPSVFTASTATPETSRHLETGAFYGDDIHDRRGEARLTARAFGELLVAQPEFKACMVEYAERHVLGVATPAERADLQHTFQETGRLRPLFATALRRYAARSAAASREPAIEAAPLRPARSSPDGRVALSDRLVGLLDDGCRHCHQEGPQGFLANLGGARALDRERLLAMANLVASGLMPKDEWMLEPTRRELLQELAFALAPDPAWARTAFGYWSGDDFQPSRVHHIEAHRNRVVMEAGGPADPSPTQRFVDFSLEKDLLRLTPGAVMVMGELAAKACAHVPARERYACFVRATRPDVARVEQAPGL